MTGASDDRRDIADADSEPDSFRPMVSVIPPAPISAPASAPDRSAPRGSRAARLLAAVALVLACGSLTRGATPYARALATHFVAGVKAIEARVWRTPEPEAPAPAASEAPRADAKLVRAGRSPVGAGLLVLPPSFHSRDGAYDLVVHFHGNTDLVEDSFGIAGVDAAVVIVNLGIGSGVYEDRFASPDETRELLARVQRTLERRGLANAHLRRLGLSSWSAGYGAIVRIIENPALAEQVDAIVLLDGLHARTLPEGEPGSVGARPHAPGAGQIDLLRIDPFVRFARAAAQGQKLFVVTHSEVKPPGYAGCHETADALLQLLHVERTAGGAVPAMPALSSSHGVPKSKMVGLEPLTEAHAGGLVVRGYGGETPEHHMAHLIQMATVGLPELAQRFGEPR